MQIWSRHTPESGVNETLVLLRVVHPQPHHTQCINEFVLEVNFPIVLISNSKQWVDDFEEELMFLHLSSNSFCEIKLERVFWKVAIILPSIFSILSASHPEP